MAKAHLCMRLAGRKGGGNLAAGHICLTWIKEALGAMHNIAG